MGRKGKGIYGSREGPARRERVRDRWVPGLNDVPGEGGKGGGFLEECPLNDPRQIELFRGNIVKTLLFYVLLFYYVRWTMKDILRTMTTSFLSTSRSFSKALKV